MSRDAGQKPLPDGTATLVKPGSAMVWAYLDKAGIVHALPPGCDASWGFVQGFALVSSSQRQPAPAGLMDTSFKLVLPVVYDEICRCGEGAPSGMLVVAKSDVATQQRRYGLMDTGGHAVLAPCLLHAPLFNNGIARVQGPMRFGLMDVHGQRLTAPLYDEIGEFSEGLVPVRSGGKLGFVDSMGRQVIPIQFPCDNLDRFGRTECFSEGLAAVHGEDRRYGFIDRTGKWVIQPRFSGIGTAFSGGNCFVIGRGPAYEVIDRAGNTVRTCPGFGGSRGEGLVGVQHGSLWSYEGGAAAGDALPGRFEYAGPFRDGLALVEQGGHRHFIDHAGSTPFILPPEADFTHNEPFSGGMIAFRQNDKWGYYDAKGRGCDQREVQLRGLILRRPRVRGVQGLHRIHRSLRLAGHSASRLEPRRLLLPWQGLGRILRHWRPVSPD